MESERASLTWIKSSFSMGGGACVELATDGEAFALRDSKDPTVHLHYTYQEIEAFILGAKNGDFDSFLR
ncbi:DUF397 domain-containing protein [Pseudonocardia broussonetiae]|nr:DUF397 domain-containing protein [Pseudonocardia broussonetiae]